MVHHNLQGVYASDAFYQNHMLYRTLNVQKDATTYEIKNALQEQKHSQAKLKQQHETEVNTISQKLLRNQKFSKHYQNECNAISQSLVQLKQNNKRQVDLLSQLYIEAHEFLLHTKNRNWYDAQGDFGVAKIEHNTRYAIQARENKIQPPEDPSETILAQPR